MTHNPYTAPGSLVGNEEASTIRVYSPNQAACGALIGGPVGLTYFLWSNFSALGNYQHARTTIILGVMLIAALLVTIPFLPEDFPNTPFTVFYVVVSRVTAEKRQMSKSAIEESEKYIFHSNWRVFWLGLLSGIASVAAVAGPIILFNIGL